MPASRVYNPYVGATSGGGGGGVTPADLAKAEEIQTLEFTYSMTTSLIFNIPSNAKVLQVSIAIQTVFNDASTTIMVGDSSLNNRLLSSSQNDPTELGTYQAHSEYEYSSSTAINIYINSGTSSQGAGFVSIIYNLNN